MQVEFHNKIFAIHLFAYLFVTTALNLFQFKFRQISFEQILLRLKFIANNKQLLMGEINHSNDNNGDLFSGRVTCRH